MEARMTAPELSIVVPIYNEAESLVTLLARLQAVLATLPGSPTYEIVAVDDGSRDESLARLRALREQEPGLVIVALSRNFGHQIAATAGLDAARGAAVILIDADLQDPPELIPTMVARWREGYDVVYAVRHSRPGESLFKLLTARLFYRVIRRMTNVEIPLDTGDFRLMSRRVVTALGQIRERHRFLRGLVSWVGYRQIGVRYDRAPRYAGRSKYPLSRMLRFAFDGLTSFSEIPLRIATYFGFVTSGFAFCYAVVVIVLKLLQYNLPGYTSMMVTVLFLGGVQLIGIGILGEYVGRIYDEIKGRPLYLVASHEGAGREQVRPSDWPRAAAE